MKVRLNAAAAEAVLAEYNKACARASLVENVCSSLEAYDSAAHCFLCNCVDANNRDVLAKECAAALRAYAQQLREDAAARAVVDAEPVDSPEDVPSLPAPG